MSERILLWIAAAVFLAGRCPSIAGELESGAKPASSSRPPALVPNVVDAKGLDQALERLHAPMRETPALSPQEEQRRFKPRPGLAVDLVAAEPQVRQPVCINFDERGRMWVVQYIQYPFPAGMKVVEYDQYIRAKFDKVSPPPPHQFPGHDRITILEDAAPDGTFQKVKTFADGLNIATSALPGRGGRGPGDYGVWVLNPPYLLFYPDKDRDDLPDGDPIVHLSGFGLEDTHAVANNLTWGPDGWLYGCQGSTCTAHVKVEIDHATAATTDFLGQAIWRYHPETHRFEIFAEGGGNTFGLEFDDAGRAYSGTNWGRYRGLHFVQGGYYLKSWGKHGPLTNPFAFGYFDHMPHAGNADRLSNTFIVYGGTLLGAPYIGKIISPNPLQSRVQVTDLVPAGSSYRTVEEPFMATCDDGWFRPVDLKEGPEGAVYVADFYERRITHVDPRDTWDRTTGRIWRIRPVDWKAGLRPFDLERLTGAQLVAQLASKDRWTRATARRVLADRREASVAPLLRRMLVDGAAAGQQALEALWALNLVGAMDDEAAAAALGHREPTVRMWAVRLLGDIKGKAIPSLLFEKLLNLASREADPQVRSQLASTAKRLPAEQAIPLVRQMMTREQDLGDVHIPLLLWWAVEDKAVSNRDRVVSAFSAPDVWRQALATRVILPRLARRYAADPTPENQDALAKLLKAVPDNADREVLLSGIKEGFIGLSLINLRPALAAALSASADSEIALRLGDPAALTQSVKLVDNESADPRRRIRLIGVLSELGDPRAAPALIHAAESSSSDEVRRAAINGLGRFNDGTIGRRLVKLYPTLPPRADLRPAVISALLARPAWTAELLRAVDAGAIRRSDIGVAQMQQIRAFNDPDVAALADKLFGKQAKATSKQKEAEIARVRQLVTSDAGDARAGRELFTARCATCHTLFGMGGRVGPDLTGYERRNVDFLLISVIDPSAYVREEYTTFRIQTRGGQTLIGLIAQRGPNQVTLLDAAQQETVVAKDQIVDERALPSSIMPEGLLDGLGDQQVRDLFKYLSATRPPP